jgi:hypothetical protein
LSDTVPTVTVVAALAFMPLGDVILSCRYCPFVMLEADVTKEGPVEQVASEQTRYAPPPPLIEVITVPVIPEMGRIFDVSTVEVATGA